MSTSKNGLDAFERSLRDSLDQFEVPYNSADWTQMERTLNGGDRGWWVSGIGLSVLVAGVLTVGGTVWYALESGKGLGARTAAGSMAAVVPTNGGGPEMTENAQPAKAPATVPEMAETTVPATEPATNTSAGTAHGTIDPIVARTAATQPSGTEKKPAMEKEKTAPAASKDAASSGDASAFRASVGEGCPGTSVEFKVSNMPEDGIYLWNFGDGSFSNKANPEHTFTKPGSYQVMLSMSAAGVGTIQNKPSSDVIVIHEAPMAAFNVLKQEYEGHLPSVHFENRSLAGKAYLWNFGDGETSTIAHPDHIYQKKGVYQVELTVTNDIGCVDKVMKDVRIEKDYNLDAPASFSPNGDDSQEAFIPEALRSLGVKFHLAVYAPSGTLMYETTDATKPWLGKLNNRGEVLPAGEYVWVVDVRESLHLAETYTGKVRLER